MICRTLFRRTRWEIRHKVVPPDSVQWIVFLYKRLNNISERIISNAEIRILRAKLHLVSCADT